MAFVEHFIDNLFSIEEFELGTLKLSPELIEKEEPIPMNEKMKYICISPIIPKKPDYIDPGSKSFINPEEDQFSDLIYDLTMRRMEKFGAYSENDIDSFYKFQLVPDKEYLHKLYQRKKKFARVYPVYDKDIKYEVRGYTFPFTLYAHPKVQEFVFNNGMGAFCHKGFGMLDIANSDPSKRVIMKRAREFA
jgi:CRISPR-associated endoribonuclease Cas6